MPVGVSAYVPLANVTFGASAASVTFSNINQGYRDLVLVIQATSTASYEIKMNFNNDSGGTTYNSTVAQGNGSSTGATNFSTYGWLQSSNIGGSIGTAAGTHIYNIFDYSTTDKHKSSLARVDAAGLGTTMAAGRWANTAAITSIALTLTGAPAGLFTAGSSFALYGVSA